jgi:hypothetical protein
LRFWLVPVFNNTNALQRYYYTYTFAPAPMVKADIYLNAFSGGVDFDQHVLGVAAAVVKSYTYLDDSGNSQVVDLTGQDIQGGVTVPRLTGVTWELAVQKAWAAAHGTVYRMD